jgi:4-hydroxy-tetrahydrodipicolinate synthase
MVLPVGYWKLSKREILKHFLSIGDAIGIPIMMHNNPGTSGVDMSPELVVRMFATIDIVSMVKESTGDLPECGASNRSAAVGCRSTTAAIRGCWTCCKQAPRVGARPRRVYHRSRASTCATRCVRTNYQEREPVTPGSSRSTVKAGLELLGVGVGDPR